MEVIKAMALTSPSRSRGNWRPLCGENPGSVGNELPTACCSAYNRVSQLQHMDIGGLYPLLWASQVAPVVKKPTCHCKRHKRHGSDPWVRKIPWRREWQPTPVFLAGESHGQRSLAGSSSWGCKESGTTEVT